MVDVFYPLQWIADKLTYEVFGIAPDTRLGASVNFVIYDVMKIFILLALMIFVVSYIRTYLTSEKTRRVLKYSPGFFGGEIGSDVGDDKDHQGQQDEDFHHIVNDEVDTCSKARIRCNPEHLICQFVSNPLKGIEYINHFRILLLEIYYLFFTSCSSVSDHINIH